jgi:hypothetical protein
MRAAGVSFEADFFLAVFFVGGMGGVEFEY